ncbi:MAG: disulfide oxidoreductase [Caldilineaceae bacterium]
MAERLSEWLDRNSLYIALLAAWIAMLGSLYFSEVAHYTPCLLCWYQRILMYPLTVILAVGLLRSSADLPYFVLPLSGLGACVSTYHYLVQKTNLFSGATTCQVGAPCSMIWINWFGFVTIPFLALVAFVTITIMTIIALQAGEPAFAESRPTPTWRPVVAIVLVVMVAFTILWQLNRKPVQAQAPFNTLETGAPMLQTDGTPVGVADSSGDASEGQRLYHEVCAVCHGQQGEGAAGLGTALRDSAFVAEHSDAELLAMIRAGRAANDPANQSGLVMPASGGRPDLSDTELLAVIAYLRSPALYQSGETQ